MTYLQELTLQAIDSVQSCEEVSEKDIWSKHGPSIWQAKRFIGSPHFYPVYRYRNYYSYSILSLIVLKGTLRLNRRVAQTVARTGFKYYSGKDTIDREITRVGGPPKHSFRITETDHFVREIAQAMREDAGAVESRHRGFTNIILCGGKDSLNLSLLPWRNPVLLASAPPNFDLVKTFVSDNGLSHDVIRLDDDDNSLIGHEIAVNCCRMNLEHCRWGHHLKEIAEKCGKKVIFWKGQLGDTFMTSYWKTYVHQPSVFSELISRACRMSRGRGEGRLNQLLEKSTLTQRHYMTSVWNRGAMWQGTHMSVMRELTNCLVLSGYHGSEVRRVVCEVDLARAVQNDIRPLVGKYLRGRPVVYPATNPGPVPSSNRKDISHVRPFVETLSSVGIRIDSE